MTYERDLTPSIYQLLGTGVDIQIYGYVLNCSTLEWFSDIYCDAARLQRELNRCVIQVLKHHDVCRLSRDNAESKAVDMLYQLHTCRRPTEYITLYDLYESLRVLPIFNFKCIYKKCAVTTSVDRCAVALTYAVLECGGYHDTVLKHMRCDVSDIKIVLLSLIHI